VVARGFARRMSVRLGVPTELADAVLRKLAALRASTAQWVANDAYACLAINGFLKDFDFDFSAPPLSYCTLTVEGLTETEPFVDAGGDPAPFGQTSTLRLLQPATITDAALVSSSLAETDYPQWAAGTAYALGARVLRGSTHRIYESAAAGNVGNDPAIATGKWSDIGPTNRFAMFDQALGSTSDNAATIAVTLDAATINAVALLDVTGTSVRVQATGYDQTRPVGAGAITFLDLPAGVTRATVTLTGSGTVSIGTLLVGKLVGLGVTEASPTAGITDFSRKDVDDFGAVTIVERAWAKRMTANALISTSAIDSVFSRLAAVRATPSLWIGQAGYDSLTIYGFFKEFSIEAGDTVSKLSLSIEGLSTAGKITPFAPGGGGGSVDWPNVGDPDGTKPANNADVTGQNTSKDTNAVGGKPSAEFLAELAAARAQLAYIDGTTIPTINTAVANANTRIDAARQTAADAVAAANVKIAAAQTDLDKAVSDLAAEVLRAQGKDEELAQRISAISASGGYDDTSIRALVQTVDTARADDKRAIASRVDNIVTSYNGQFTTTNGRVSQNFTTLSNDDMALASRIDSVISEYKGLDTATNARVTTNIAVLADADRALGQRIDSLVVEGGGYDDTSVRAAITTNNTASIDRDSAIGQRVDNIVTSYNGQFTTTNARIDTVSTTATTAKDAVASLTTSVNTRFTGVNDTLGNYDQRITTLSTNVTSYAGRTTKLEAAAMSGGVYLSANPTYAIWPDGQRFATGWSDWNGPANLAVVRRANTDRADSPYYLDANQTAPNINIGHLQVVPACQEAGWYVFTAEADLQGGTWEGCGITLGGAYNLDFCGVADSAGDISATKTGNRRWSLLFQKPKDTSQNFHAMQSWDGFGRSRPQKVVYWRHASIRAANDGEIKAGKANTDLTSVTARVKTTEDTLADLPNRYAAASRTATLEAQVQGDSGSRLLSRASEQATVIADEKAGAVAQTVSTLRGEYNATYGQVQQQAGVLAGVNGRTSVYWQVTGTTPDGSATVQLSKADGSPGLFYIGANLLVDGNAIFNGTVTIRALDRSTMTATTSGSVSGSYGGAGQAAFAYIPNLGADMAIKSGGSIYLTFTGNIAATTDSSGTIYASFEILNAANNSVLASVRLPTPGFGPSGRLDNFVIRILNVWGDFTLRWRVANRTTGTTWSIVQNPQCSVYWTAL
jgi:hypothetical protein